ncbi:MAG: radical SAM protein [Candidatus Coatesbacteria bacterium]|nr:MAG: radical SAM protein [Candidatus Coatesbacteria bacterium]
MPTCQVCHTESPTIAGFLGVCRACIVERPDDARPFIDAAHRANRERYGLPPFPPDDPEGRPCRRCGNECRIPPGERGYCGMVENADGRVRTLATVGRGYLSWYHDPLPTNCVGSWVCPGETGAGHPRYANRPGPEHGYTNLAVFYHSCTFSCLFCQNSHFRHEYLRGAASAEDLAGAVDARTACICYFGGDPASQLKHSLGASKLATKAARRDGRILRICWETNGSTSGRWARQMMKIALESGGCIKFDMKAADPNLHRALTGVSNRQTWENLAALAEYIPERPDPPPLVASTPLVPGYVDAKEVGAIAARLAALDADIPYSLLGFHPAHRMNDLPTTSAEHARRCVEAAESAGLTRVHVGNRHLLSRDDYGEK